MTDRREPHLVVETEPDPAEIRFLQDELYAHAVQATGIADGELFGLFLRGPDGKAVGGAYGWTWGDTCYLRYLFVPANMRKQGCGSKLMRAVEQEALARRCGQIVLETHDFQAPDFYRKLGFAVVGALDGYPRGHRYLTMLKRLR